MTSLPIALAVLMPAALAISVAAPAPVAAQGGPPLTMTCHLLLRGVPMPDATTYMLIGADLFSKSDVGVTRISTAGRPMYLGRTVDKGVVSLSYADHTRIGRIVTRRVYWKDGAKPRRLAFTERYDFLNQTVTSRGEGDFCHHNGK